MNKIIGIIVVICMFLTVLKSFYLIKKTKAFAFLYMYIFIWLIFGSLYWSFATFSNNENFIFQNDIKVNAISKTLYYKFDTKYSKKDIANIIKDKSYFMVCMKSAVAKEDIFFVDGEIGDSWADLYYNSFLKSGYTHYDQEFILEMKNPIDNPYIATEEEFFLREGQTKDELPLLKMYKINLYKANGNENKIILESNKEKYEKRTCYIFTEHNLNTLSIEGKQIELLPLSFGLGVKLSKSYNLQDNSIWQFKEIEMGKVPYQIMDFLYFSAVTITTLGYGDILPNSTIIRCMVMLQTLSGLIIIGIFISRLLDKEWS
ncbi:potassium channel family protein [Wukongibacter baidiensis]|uniref:potassium channel family protein n=1 Tax=Wukongibacter baidiensis TaxID=1723361 RepID=UPI003D7FDFA4